MAHAQAAGVSLAATTTDAGPIDAIDPRTRALATVAFAVVVVGLDGIVPLLAALVSALVAARAARLPWRPTARKVLMMDGFMLALFVMLPFTTPGEPLVRLGPLTASVDGLRLALTIALQANAIVLLLLALVGTIQPARLGHALLQLGVPTALVQLLFFTVRYIDVLGEEYRRLRTAMRARAFVARTDRHTLETFGYLVGMLLVRASDRAERVLAAMRCRGFDGRFPVLVQPKLGRRDIVWAVVAASLLGALLVLEVRLGRLA